MRKAPVLTVDRDSVRPAVDFLRGFAIFTVVLMHLIQLFLPGIPTWLWRLSALGGTGAHVFIFCSGFGLCFSRLQRPLSPTAFLRRRFCRIYLPYAAVVLLSAAVPLIDAGGNRLMALMSHLFLFKMFVPAYMESFGVHFWFISAILGLYLLFLPLFAGVKRFGRRTMLAVCFGVSLAWWIFLALTGLWHERIWNSFCLQFLWEFVLGMALADFLYAEGKLKLSLPALSAAAVAGLSLQATLALSENVVLRVFNDLPALFGYGSAALLFYLLCRGRAIGSFSPSREFLTGGICCICWSSR